MSNNRSNTRKKVVDIFKLLKIRIKAAIASEMLI